MVVLTAPVIYAGILPFALLDLFVGIYQAVCFPIYGIAKVKRGESEPLYEKLALDALGQHKLKASAAVERIPS